MNMDGTSALKPDIFQAIADPTRRQMLVMLAEQELPIAAIASRFPLSRSGINKHLCVLSDAGLVRSHRVGREHRYTLKAEPLREVREWMQFFEQYWDRRLLALQAFVEDEQREG